MKSESHADLDVGVPAGFHTAVVLPVPFVEEVPDFCGHGLLLFVAELETESHVRRLPVVVVGRLAFGLLDGI